VKGGQLFVQTTSILLLRIQGYSWPCSKLRDTCYTCPSWVKGKMRIKCELRHIRESVLCISRGSRGPLAALLENSFTQGSTLKYYPYIRMAQLRKTERIILSHVRGARNL
jgi:hypothetical protein